MVLSTSEAEYISLIEAIKEALWLRGFVKELGLSEEDVYFSCDSQGSIHLSKHNVFHERIRCL